MPYNKLSLSEITVENEEYLDIDSIAERLEVSNRTIERLIEEFAKKLKKSRRRRGRKIVYLWTDVLESAKVHTKTDNKNRME